MRPLTLLHKGQSVHVCTQADHPWRASSAQNADHARSTDALMHLQPRLTQHRCDDARGSALFERQLGMSVQIASQRNQIGQKIVNACTHGSIPPVAAHKTDQRLACLMAPYVLQYEINRCFRLGHAGDMRRQQNARM